MHYAQVFATRTVRLHPVFFCTMAAICVLLLFSGFPAVNKRYSASRKRQTTVKETEGKDGRYASRQSNATKMTSFDKHLLERGFTAEQVKCCVVYHFIFSQRIYVFFLIDRLKEKEKKLRKRWVRT